jgi:hypothetical protein
MADIKGLAARHPVALILLVLVVVLVVLPVVVLEIGSLH